MLTNTLQEERLDAVIFLCARVHRIDLVLKVVIYQVFERVMANLAWLAGSPDDSDTVWLKEKVKLSRNRSHGYASMCLKNTVASGGNVRVRE